MSATPRPYGGSHVHVQTVKPRFLRPGEEACLEGRDDRSSRCLRVGRAMPRGLTLVSRRSVSYWAVAGAFWGRAISLSFTVSV